MMKKTPFSFHGAFIGALYALYGSIWFTAFVVMLFFLGGDDVGMVAYVFFVITLFSFGFSILPGMLGGVHLARWIERSDRSHAEINRRGRLVGIIAGVAAIILSAVVSVPVTELMGGYVLMAVFGLIAILIAGGLGELGARRLEKRLEKFK